LLLVLSLALNGVVLCVGGCVVLPLVLGTRLEDVGLHERYHSGSKTATDKIAIVSLDGVMLEGLLGYTIKQIETAAKDGNVKAVVLRVNSPGGSITASDDLHRRLRQLHDGDAARGTHAKPVIVSMASLAASGAYYAAMPAQHIVAERTTITGSIGVYAAFPNVAELARKYGVKMIVIKAGDVKDSGNMFHDMSAQERELWQEMVDHAYGQFLEVVREGRGKKLKLALQAEIPSEKKKIPVRDSKGKVVEEVEYIRRLADGGIYTADQALKYGLIDEIGYLDQAIAAAQKAGGLGQDFRVITYDRPPALLNLFLGANTRDSSPRGQWSQLASGAVPRLWYLNDESWLSAFLAAGDSQ
jgi:protease-4